MKQGIRRMTDRSHSRLVATNVSSIAAVYIVAHWVNRADAYDTLHGTPVGRLSYLKNSSVFTR